MIQILSVGTGYDYTIIMLASYFARMQASFGFGQPQDIDL